MEAAFPLLVLRAAILGLWLLLNGFAPAQFVLGLLLAWIVPRLLPAPVLPSPKLAAPATAIRLAAVVLYDIVRANLEIALRILGPESRIRPAWVWVPLDLSSPQGIAMFASIITMTPGTLSCEVSEDRRWLLVHAFHADDPAAVVADVKARYEAPLKEIFR